MVYFVTAIGRMKKRLLSRQTPGVEEFKWRATYDALGIEPPFDDLPTKEQYEADHADRHRRGNRGIRPNPGQRGGAAWEARGSGAGKKKQHTLKTEYLTTKAGRIASVSPSHPGSRHPRIASGGRLTIRREGPRLPEEAHLYGDSGYQGYGNDHRNFDHPYKKPKGGN